jgi:hypothetical protein
MLKKSTTKSATNKSVNVNKATAACGSAADESCSTIDWSYYEPRRVATATIHTQTDLPVGEPAPTPTAAAGVGVSNTSANASATFPAHSSLLQDVKDVIAASTEGVTADVSTLRNQVNDLMLMVQQLSAQITMLSTQFSPSVAINTNANAV